MLNNDYTNQIEDIQKAVNSAISAFNEKEMYLIENDLSERCICARFAIYLADVLKDTQFKDYIVDVEYNRGNDGRKRGIKIIEGKPITVDLIVHKRGYDRVRGFDNLICIEMKKSTNRRGCADDECRLLKLISDEYGFCYKAGFMILINMKKNDSGLKIKKSFWLIA